MIKYGLTVLGLVLVICNCSTNKVFHFNTLNSISNDIEAVSDTTIVLLQPFLKNNADSIIVKNFHILFTDYQDSVIVKSKKEYAVKINTEHVTNSEYEIIESTFEAFSNRVYFLDTYWAKLTFDYVHQDSIYTFRSTVKFENRKKHQHFNK